MDITLKQARKADALEALLRYLADPKYVIRWESSRSMVSFLLDHLDRFVDLYADKRDVMVAAETLRAEVRS